MTKFNKALLVVALAFILTFTGCFGAKTTPPVTEAPSGYAQMQADIAALNTFKNSTYPAAIADLTLKIASIPTSAVKQADIDTLNTRLTTLQAQVAAIQIPVITTTPAGITQAQLDALKAIVDADVAKLTIVSTDLKDLQIAVTSLTNTVSSLQSSITTINAKNAAQDSAIAALQTTPPVTQPNARPYVRISGVGLTSLSIVVEDGGAFPIVLTAYGTETNSSFNVSANGGITAYATITNDERVINNPISGLLGTINVDSTGFIVTGSTAANWAPYIGVTDLYIRIGNNSDPVPVQSVDGIRALTLRYAYSGSARTGLSYGFSTQDESPNLIASVVIFPSSATAWKAGDTIIVTINGLSVQYATAQAGG